MINGPQLRFQMPLTFYGAGNTLTSGQTGYLRHTAVSTAITVNRFTAPFAGTVSMLYVRTSTAQPSTGSLTFTVTKNGVASTIVATIAANAAAGQASDLTHSFTVAAGDEVEIVIQNNATSTSAAVRYASLLLEGNG